jgi:hypothetical protein
MNTKRLHTQLVALQKRSIDSLQRLSSNLDVCHQDRKAAEAEIQALRQKLEKMAKQERKLRVAMADQTERLADEQRDAAIVALRESFASFVRGHDYWIRRARMEGDIQTLWAADPALTSKIEAYHKVEANAEHYLVGIPELMRDAIAQTLRSEQEKIHAQIAPFLDIQARLGALRPEHPFTLQVVAVHEPEDALVTWILPFPADAATLPTDAAPVLSRVADEVMKGIGGFGKHQGWRIDDIDTAGWEGFTVLLALATYQGDEAFDVAAQTLLSTILTTAPLFQGVELEVRVDQIPKAAWHRGRQDTLISTTTAEDAADEPEDSAPDRQPLHETSKGWYTNDDLRTWGAKKDSKQSPQARRMRTLLMRMVGRGMIGGVLAPIDLLSDTLPPKHATEMRRGIDDMVGVGLLMRSEMPDNSGAGVTINSAMLSDIQSLINREPTELWTNIVGTVPKSSGTEDHSLRSL